VNTAWWESHVVYSKFRRQGIDIICASFKHAAPKANIIFLTGLTESFIKYSEVIQYLFERGFNVFTYDHQSQGLSGRCKQFKLHGILLYLIIVYFSGLAESQSIWVNAFEDYIDDFVYFVTTINKEYTHLPTFLVAHSMGGFIAAVAMSRLPTLINRAVLCAPMLRNKCGMKVTDMKYPLPQPVAYWLTQLSCYLGMGTMHAIGYFKEKPTDKLPLDMTTTDPVQLEKWRALRMKYPHLITTCVTNDWTVQAIRAQKKFSTRYEFVRTNTLILR
jgi:lysophospholipase